MMGVVGIETAFALMYTHFVRNGKMSLRHLVKLLCDNPRARFGLGNGVIKVGEKADFTVFNLEESYHVNPDEFLSMGRSTPFEGEEVWGRCKLTFADGNLVWREV